jgi:hypothetical protein
LADTVNGAVKEHAADVDLDLFWAYGVPRAQRETPAALTDPVERLSWQTRRAVDITRAKQQALGIRPPADPTDSQPKPKTFVEQMRELRQGFRRGGA